MEIILERDNESSKALFLPEPTSVDETGLDYGLILDLCLKTIYSIGRPPARVVCERMCLPFKVMEGALEFLRRQEYLEIVGSTGVNEQDYQYSLTSKGQHKTQEVLEANHYIGPTPVPFDFYTDVVSKQSVAHIEATPENLARAFQKLVLHPETVQQLGTAVGSGRSIFIYGPPGNGKSTVAECLVSLLSDQVLIPYAVEAFGQIIRVHDPRVHLSGDAPVVSQVDDNEITQAPDGRDKRWEQSYRPLIIGGGEITMADLELRYSAVGKFYVAPAQVKANNGVLVIDDFGRQVVRPEEMLNRWMIPMDRRIDHLTLQTGETLTVPFDVMLLFATNLQPSQLGDEAFFRRIRHKIRISDPTEEEFRRILRMVAAERSIAYDEETAEYLIEAHYKQLGRPFRGVHPRDLFDLMEDMARYQGSAPVFDRTWVDRACRSYFVED
jgi:hypothetical protein